MWGLEVLGTKERALVGDTRLPFASKLHELEGLNPYAKLAR